MRIVDVAGFYTPHGGGVRTYIERKLRAGPAAGCEIVVIAPGEHYSVNDYGNGAWLVTIPGPAFPLDRRYRYFEDEARLHAELDWWKPDIVEASSPWSSAEYVASWQGPARKALVMHSDPLSAYAYRWFGGFLADEQIDRCFQWFWRKLRRYDDQFDFIVSASEDLSNRLIDGGLNKVLTVPMGVEPGIFSPRLRDEALRAELLARCGLPPSALLLTGVGRLAPEKRWPMVMEAVDMAGTRRPVGLVLIGDGRDRTRVSEAASLRPHVAMFASAGSRAKLASILASSDALVHGCEAETFGMVPAEARASGLPLIVPDRGGASDQFRSGQGVKYRAKSGADLAQKIRDFSEADPIAHRLRATADAPNVRTMDMHFGALFAAYRGANVRELAA